MLFFFFHVVLSKLSSSPSTLDRHFTIYLQREQFLSCHLPANNVKEHTGGNLRLYPLSQKCACTVMTQRSALSDPGSAASFGNGTQPVPPFSRHPSCQKPLTPRGCPRALPELSPSLPPAKAISLKTKKCSFHSSTLTTHEVRKDNKRFFPKHILGTTKPRPDVRRG